MCRDHRNAAERTLYGKQKDEPAFIAAKRGANRAAWYDEYVASGRQAAWYDEYVASGRKAAWNDEYVASGRQAAVYDEYVASGRRAAWL